MPAATPDERVVSGEWRIARLSPYSPFRYSLFAKLLLLTGDGLGRTLARARIGVGALTAHRQAAAMAQAAIAAEIHQTLDVHAGLATQIAFDHIVAVDHFADLQHFLVAQLRHAAVIGNLDLLQDLGSVFLADAMDVLERDQDALVGRDIHAGNTGHGLLSCRRSLGKRLFFAISGRCSQTRTRRPPLGCPGARHRLKLSDWIGDLLKDSTRFRQPSLCLSSLFRDFFRGFPGFSGSPGLGTRRQPP